MRRKIFDDATETSHVDEDELYNLVKDYINNKTLESEYKNLASSGNTKIKKIMSTRNLSSFSCDYGTVTLSERKSESFEEEALIEFLKSSGHSDIVRTKECVDYDALESAIYHEKISKEEVKQMDKYKVTKVTQVLNIK